MKLTYVVAVALIFSAFGSFVLPTTGSAQYRPPYYSRDYRRPPPPDFRYRRPPPPDFRYRRPPPVYRWQPPVRRWAPPPPPRYCNIRACSARYRSFRAWDCTYQPYNGPRRRCRM
nr:BA14K family protein [uncultured Cohaesibacter sp.]